MLKKINIILWFILFFVLITGRAFAALDADIISHTMPVSVAPGDVFQVSVTVQNISTAGENWQRPRFRLVSQSNPDNIWGPTLAQLAKKENIQPDTDKTFSMIFTAPATPGSYPCKWQMKRQPGSAFGEMLDLTVEVTDATPKMLDAAVVSHTIPSAMCAGETRSIAITMRNTGSTKVWYQPDFEFLAQNSPQPDDQWGTSYSSLNSGEDIRPGATKTFTIDITAPVTPGSYNCNWQMNISTVDGIQLFGEKIEKVVSVVDEGVTCDDGNECTGNGTCIGAACTGTSPLADGTVCDAVNICTSYTCTGGVCGGTINQGAPCDDGNNCTASDTCSAEGICTGSLMDCSGLDDACTLGICNPYNNPPSCEQDVTHKNYTACSDDIFCNGPDMCISGTCALHNGDPCTDDGHFCNGTESCDEGNDQCLSSGDPCAEGTVCNEEIDICFVTPCFVDTDCDDGKYCTGVETCDGGTCITGTPIDCPNDGFFCTGTESCDEATDSCVSSGNPCEEGTVCNEDIDFCFVTPCFVDTDCDDGIYCTGVETCDGGTCITGTPVVCNDGIDCTIDSCYEATESCIYTHNNELCNDGQFCNGNEVCDPDSGCQPGTPVDCPDDGLFCTGTVSCDEAIDSCVSSGNPCEEGTVCNEDADSCDTVECTIDVDCDDEIYCNGEETCDVYTCISGIPVDCNDGIACTIDSCNEDADTCDHIPSNGVCDDGQFCNGTEICDPVSGCQAGTPVECPDDGLFCNGTESCNEITDSCSSSGNPCPGGTTCNESGDACISMSTTTTTIPATTTSVPATTTIPDTTTTIPTGICAVVISPESQTVAPGETIPFSAISTCEGVEVEGTYVWEIMPASGIGSSIDSNTGIYVAGTNTTGYDSTETIQVTDTTHNTIDTAETVVTPIQPVCETIIDPSAATVDSEESITFTASTVGKGCAEPDYTWDIATDLDSWINAGGASCLYQAGTNKTGMLHTDTVTVVDRANGTSAELAVTVYYGRIKNVFPRTIGSSRSTLLPYIIYIIGEGTGFNPTSWPYFTPVGSIMTIGRIWFRDFMAALVLVSPHAEQERIDLAVPMINAAGQEVTFSEEDALSVRLLPIGLDVQKNNLK